MFYHFSDISVKTINNETFAYSILPSTIVIELKRLLSESTTIDIIRQRLIFRGRVLQDDLPLSDYNINSGHVLHMVARPVNDTEHPAEHSSGSSGSAERTSQAERSSEHADNRNIRQNVMNTTNEYGLPSFLSDPEGASPAAQAAHMHRLNRNDLEMLNQLMSGT
jgi:hypothetical protein